MDEATIDLGGGVVAEVIDPQYVYLHSLDEDPVVLWNYELPKEIYALPHGKVQFRNVSMTLDQLRRLMVHFGYAMLLIPIYAGPGNHDGAAQMIVYV